MSGFQKVTYIGNAGGDAELRTVGNDGKQVLSFSLAVSQGKNKPTMWVRVTMWVQESQLWLADAVTKGRQVFVDGYLTFDAETGGPKIYTKRDGTPGASFEVTANSIIPLGASDQNGNSEPKEEDIPF